MINAQIIKEKAREFGADQVGIGSIDLYEGTDPRRDPRLILPGAACVIACAFRVPRALYRVMKDKTQFFNYTQLGVKFIDEQLAEIFLLKMAGLIENEGYDACVQRNISNLRVKGDGTTNPEVIDTYELANAEAVAPGKPVPDIIMDFNQTARICGLGSAGMSGNLIVPKLGPFVRMVCVVTDAPLECDPPFKGSLCDRCGECVKACPGHAVSENGTDSWQCSVYYRGAHESNPFMTGDFLADDPDRESVLKGTKRFDRTAAREIFPKLDFLPSHATGYAPCLCGKSCDERCFQHLKELGLLN